MIDLKSSMGRMMKRKCGEEEEEEEEENKIEKRGDGRGVKYRLHEIL